MATSAAAGKNTPAQRTQHQDQGGFECIFVKGPPEHLQTECSVCLCVLREPVLVDCCGNSFCTSCIEPIKAERKPCPLCAVHFTGCMPDKRLQRTLNEMQVYCSHKEEGCEWVGKLANLEPHLNVSPPPSEKERLLGCQLTSLECRHCGECFKRRDLEDHETSACVQRPYTCEYCCDFKSTYEKVTLKHLSLCSHRPVPCPNRCGSSPKLKLVNNHLKECPLEVVECPFGYTGCNERLPRKNMSNHITQGIASHMFLLATSHEQQQQRLSQQISELKNAHRQEVVKLNQQISQLEAQLREATKFQEKTKSSLQADNQLLHSKCQRFTTRLNKLRDETKKAHEKTKQEITKQVKSNAETIKKHIAKELSEIKHEITKQVDTIEAVNCHIGLVPYTFTMPAFEQKKDLKQTWYSPCFYTHPRGYKMCLRIDANGCNESANTHVSIYVYMKKGEYDEFLKWPFRGDITVELLNQVEGDERHFSRVIAVTDDDNFGRRVVDVEKNENGLGFHQFISHADLSPYYLKDDCLVLRVRA